MGELEGRIAVVTGASQGIGAAAAERIASEGATVIVGARKLGDEADPQPLTLAWTVAQIRGRGGQAHALPLDATKPESRAAFMDEVLARFLAPAGGAGAWVRMAGLARGDSAGWRPRCGRLG